MVFGICQSRNHHRSGIHFILADRKECKREDSAEVTAVVYMVMVHTTKGGSLPLPV